MAEFKISAINGMNSADIRKAILDTVDDVLSNEVFDTIKETEAQSIVENVYNVYTPSEYQRRGGVDGLGDPDNIIMETKPHGGVLVVVNVTEPNPYVSTFDRGDSIAEDGGHGFGVTVDKDLPELVEYGHGNPYVYDFPRKGRAYMKPRPFTQKTVDYLETLGDHIYSFKVGLKNRGYTVT